jgi:alkylated DNA repair dioxygenase AlkB
MRQQELFSSTIVREECAPGIPGFHLQPDYLMAEEEQQLIRHVDAQPWQSDFRRRIQQYGLGYSSESGQAPIWLRDFPPWLAPLAERISGDALDRPAENCVINEYIPPLGIAPHRDYAAFGPVVACVSLGSDIVMDFIQPEEKHKVALHVPARSFWIISRQARWQWLHGIAPRLTDVIACERRPRARRISITFRTKRGNVLASLKLCGMI